MPDSATKSDSDRKRSLSIAVSNLIAQGRRVESQTDFSAILVRGHRPNHLVHLIATIFTFGFWGLVWLGIVLVGGEKREVVNVDEYGNVQTQQL